LSPKVELTSTYDVAAINSDVQLFVKRKRSNKLSLKGRLPREFGTLKSVSPSRKEDEINLQRARATCTAHRASPFDI
jgi:hypothetical protein